MPAIFTPKVVTANALLERRRGLPDPRRHMVQAPLTDADVLTDEADAQIRLIDASARTSEVVGVYLADVAPDAKGPQPTHFREAFRMRGPSNYPPRQTVRGTLMYRYTDFDAAFVADAQRPVPRTGGAPH